MFDGPVAYSRQPGEVVPEQALEGSRAQAAQPRNSVVVVGAAVVAVVPSFLSLPTRLLVAARP